MLWTIGMKGDKIRGKIQIRCVKNSDAITSNISVVISRVLIKQQHEARGYIDVNLSSSFRGKGELGRQVIEALKLEKFKEKISFNMDFYLMSVYSYAFRDLIKHFNDFLLKRDEKAIPLIPPLALDYYELFDERLKGIIIELKKIIEYVNPERIEITFSVGSGGKSDEVIDPAGRVLKIIALEYSNKSHLNEIKRILRRIGGVHEKELEILERKWDEGVIKLIEMAINYIEEGSLINEGFRENVIKGLKEDIEERSLSEIMNSLIRFLAKQDKDKQVINRLIALAEKLGVENLEHKIKKERAGLVKLVKLLRDGNFKEAVNIVKDTKIERSLKDFEKQVKFDNETLMAVLIFIYLLVKKDRRTLIEMAERLMYHKNTILGIIVRALKLLENGDKESLSKIYKDLSSQVAIFTYSEEVVKFPYNILVVSMYMTLTEIAKLLGKKQAEKRASAVATRLLNKMGLMEVIRA